MTTTLSSTSSLSGNALLNSRMLRPTADSDDSPSGTEITVTGKRPPTDGADPSPGSNVPPSTGQTLPDDPPKKPGGAAVSKVKTMVEYPNKEQADAVKEFRDRANAIDKALKNIRDERCLRSRYQMEHTRMLQEPRYKVSGPQ